MAGKPRNRIELRRQHEAAEDLDPVEADGPLIDDDEEVIEETKPRKKPTRAKAKPKPTARSSKAAKPAARTRIVWHVVSDAFKTVASFEYAQKAEAETKAKELNEKGKGTFFVQKVKEPMPEDAPGLGASIVKTEPETAPAKAASKPKPTPEPEIEDEDEDEILDEEEDEILDEEEDED